MHIMMSTDSRSDFDFLHCITNDFSIVCFFYPGLFVFIACYSQIVLHATQNFKSSFKETNLTEISNYDVFGVYNHVFI